MGEKYEGEREYNKLKKFVNQNSKPPCVVETLEHCSKNEKTFIGELGAWDDEKKNTELEGFKAQIETAKTTQKGLADLFEKQKDVALATMKQQEEAKTSMEKISKSLKYKVNLLEQKLAKPEEKKEL